MNKTSCVYIISTPSNKYYIGSTNNLKTRLKQHSWNDATKSKGSKYLSYAIKKYGPDNINVSIIKDNLSREEAYAIEQEYLDKYFGDINCMNFSSKACRPDNRFEVEPIKLDLETIDKQTLSSNISKELRLELSLNTLTYKEQQRKFKPDKYAIKTPDNNIVYLKASELIKYCNDNNIPPESLQQNKYSSGYYFTTDLSQEGINKLKQKKFISKKGKGRCRQVHIYKNNKLLYTVNNLRQWAKDNNIPYSTVSEAKRKGSLCRGVFRFVNVK